MSLIIPKPFFDEVYNVSSKILDLKIEILRNNVFKQNLRRYVHQFADFTANELEMLLCIDALRCGRMMGINYDADTKEAFGIQMLCYKSLVTFTGSITFRQENWNQIRNNLLPLLSQISAKESTLTSIPSPNLIIPTILGDEGADLKNQYLVKLYRWASIIAKADGTITVQEQQCLERLIQSSPEVAQKAEHNKVASNLDNNDSPELHQEENSNTTNPYDELDSLVGLGTVKEEVRTFINFVKVQQARKANGMRSSPVSYHCIFTGNPGTGKTTIARIIASIYKDLGIIKGGQLIETDRSGLVGEYIGSTAIKTNKVIDKAIDGVLFIDEAYALSEGGANDFGKEAIATLIKRMEDERDRLVVILAGYSQNMTRFLNANPGIQSRISRVIDFPDYTVPELVDIFLRNAEKYEYTLSMDAIIKLNDVIQKEYEKRSSNFGNARFVRNLFEKTIEHQANRLAKESKISPNTLAEIVGVDIY